MPTAYKILGQTASSGSYGNGAQTLVASNTNYNLYTVPAATQTVVSTITIANQTTTDATYRIAVRPAGAAIALHHYIAYNVTVGASDTTSLTLGITLNATDIITIYSSTTTLTFIAFGTEIT